MSILRQVLVETAAARRHACALLEVLETCRRVSEPFARQADPTQTAAGSDSLAAALSTIRCLLASLDRIIEQTGREMVGEADSDR